MSAEYPKVIVFDLDYTLWPCWCDTHICMPLKLLGKTEVIDKYGFRLKLFKDVESIITELKSNGVHLVGASRTATPRIAQELLSLLHVNDVPLIQFFDSLQWGQGSKIRHIKQAAKELRMTQELRNGEFILYDDESRNQDVVSINCEFVNVDERHGITRNVFDRSLEIWRSKKGK